MVLARVLDTIDIKPSANCNKRVNLRESGIFWQSEWPQDVADLVFAKELFVLSGQPNELDAIFLQISPHRHTRILANASLLLGRQRKKTTSDDLDR